MRLASFGSIIALSVVVEHMMRVFCIARIASAALTVVSVLLAALGGAVVAQEPLKMFDLTIPYLVGGLPHGQLRDHEKTSPGLGYSVPFQRQGWLIDVYLYDLGMSSIPDNPNSDVMKRQLEQAKDDVFEFERRGYYTNVVVKSDYTVNDGTGRTRFVCSAFTYVHKQIGGIVDSYLCVTGWKNKFFKIRATVRQNDKSHADATQFVDAWIGLLWPS